jgi:glycosyltransferase involved in cell wall biosynthesis
MFPAVSIIIPVYNVEKQLRRCLDSVLAQTFAAYECILVDDGSPDNCPAICDEYAAKDGRFKVIHKKQNEGLPKARKSGLDAAAAELVTHVDSDDWIEPDALKLLYSKQRETDADVVMGGIRDVYRYRETSYFYPEIKPDIEPLVYFFLYRCRNIVGKIYKKTLFDDYIVPAMNMGEDAMATVQVFSKLQINKLQKIDKIIYNYDHAGGMTTRIKNDYVSYLEYPPVKSRLWIEEYIKNQNNEIWSAFCRYMVLEGLGSYLRFNKTISKYEANMFYKRYYKKYEYQYMITRKYNFYQSLIAVFNSSILAGKIYRRIFNIAAAVIKNIPIKI